MILAACGTIDGQLSALRSFLSVADDTGIQTLLCTGNCALGPRPNECVDLLQERQVHTIQGDADRHLARFVRTRKRLQRELPAGRFGAAEQAYRACRSDVIEWLAGLPRSRTLKVDGETVQLAQAGGPGGSRVPLETDPDDVFRRWRERLPARVFVLGAGGDSFVRRVDDAVFVNPGPLLADNGRAIRYATVSTEGDEPVAKIFTLAQ